MDASRKPLEQKPGQMARLARLPVFLALDGKRALLAGGSAAAAWKAELLSAAGARVEIYAAEFSDDMLERAANPPGGVIHLVAREWTSDDFAGAAVAVGDCADARMRLCCRPARCHDHELSSAHHAMHRRSHARGVRESDGRPRRDCRRGELRAGPEADVAVAS
jgi:hypothetical protein